MLRNKQCDQSVPSSWTHPAFIYLQVDSNQSEKKEPLSTFFKSSLKRQTATGQLLGPHQTSITLRKANQATQNGTEHVEEVKGPALTGQASLQINGYNHQPHTQTQLPPQPHSDLQTHHSKSRTIPSDPSIDLPKVCCIHFRCTPFTLCGQSGVVRKQQTCWKDVLF